MREGGEKEWKKVVQREDDIMKDNLEREREGKNPGSKKIIQQDNIISAQPDMPRIFVLFDLTCYCRWPIFFFFVIKNFRYKSWLLNKNFSQKKYRGIKLNKSMYVSGGADIVVQLIPDGEKEKFHWSKTLLRVTMGRSNSSLSLVKSKQTSDVNNKVCIGLEMETCI